MNEYKNDDTIGMLWGVALGDALGVPHEFKQARPEIEYTGDVYDLDIYIPFRFATTKLPASSPSDDTEMTMALYRIIGSGYSKEPAILDYMRWANQCTMLGRNTRRLLKGIKTVAGYYGRISHITDEEKMNMQSNGSLMRASPLIIINKEQRFEASDVDVDITNPNLVNRACNRVYLECLDRCKDTSKVIEYLVDAKDDEKIPEMVRQAISDAIAKNPKRKDIDSKGWVVTSLYLALHAFLQYDTFEESMKFLIAECPGSDTDTNAAICGALWGRSMGYRQLHETQANNIGKIRVATQNAEFGIGNILQ